MASVPDFGLSGLVNVYANRDLTAALNLPLERAADGGRQSEQRLGIVFFQATQGFVDFLQECQGWRACNWKTMKSACDCSHGVVIMVCTGEQ